MTSFFESEFYVESNGGIFVGRLLFVPEIATLSCRGGPKVSMTSFSQSTFYCESIGGIFVTMLFFVPKIATLSCRGVARKFR